MVSPLLAQLRFYNISPIRRSALSLRQSTYFQCDPGKFLDNKLNFDRMPFVSKEWKASIEHVKVDELEPLILEETDQELLRNLVVAEARTSNRKDVIGLLKARLKKLQEEAANAALRTNATAKSA